MPGKKLSRCQFEILVLFFPSKQALTWHATVSSENNLHEMSEPILWENKKKNIINLSSAESDQRVVNPADLTINLDVIKLLPEWQTV